MNKIRQWWLAGAAVLALGGAGHADAEHAGCRRQYERAAVERGSDA